MSFTESIKTISEENEYKFKEKGSSFIGQAFPVDNTGEAEKKLSEIRKKFYDATHNCYAYRIINEQFKYSDDGEPTGAAGIRILNAIDHFGLSKVLLIVTRYYGGVKLGAGPLGKAYYSSAFETLSESKIILLENYSKILIEFDYDQTSKVHHFISLHNVLNIKNIFESKPQIQCLIKPNLIEKLSEQLQEVSKGKILLETIEENLFV